MNLVKRLSEEYDLIIIAPKEGKYSKILSKYGKVYDVKINRRGLNPLKDILYFAKLFTILLKERPSVFLGYTIKPNIYGGLVCRMLKIPSISTVSGLGYSFIIRSWVTKIVIILYKISLKKSFKVFFLNNEDSDFFIQKKIVDLDRIVLVPGTGIDVNYFQPVSEEVNEMKDQQKSFRFLLSARLLWDKGIWEYVEAARKILAEYNNAEFWVIGFPGGNHPSSVPMELINQWHREGIIRYMGCFDDVRPIISQVDCVVLPSYREGLSRSLLEAASMGKPIIATDVAGCKEIVEDGVTGFLCRPGDAEDLYFKMKIAIQTPKYKLRLMGEQGRNRVIQSFSDHIVIKRYLETIRAAIGGRP